jgi:hypothetical protein
MKRLLPLLALAVSVTSLSACQTAPVAGKQDAWYQYPQIRLEDIWLDGKVAFQPPVMQILPNSGLAKVDVTINNVSNDDLLLEYRWAFTERGAVVDRTTSYQRLELPRGASEHIVFTSLKPIPPSPQGDFKVEIRRFR